VEEQLGMLNWRKLLVLLVACSIFGLVGCAKETVKEIEAKATQAQEKKGDKPKPDKPKVEKPVIVNIIDPNTKAIIKSFTPKDYGFENDNAKYKAELSKWAKELARGTKDTPGYDKRMILDRIDENGQVTKGTPQTILDENELIEKLLQASRKGGEVEIPLYTTASGYKIEDVPTLDEVVVASFTTRFNGNVAGRSKNIQLSAEAINNIILGEQDSFSYNTTVGPRTAERGYQPAPEIIDGKLVDGIGGGICQTSSTLFNAIDQVPISYIERHYHSLDVGYVPKGRDATVSYGGKDFRFKNTTGVPLLLKAVYKKGSLTIEVRTSKMYKSMMKKPV
jgi:vancomycin resistance protein YoaR